MVHFLRALVHGVECPAETQANAEHLTVLFAPKRCRTVGTYGAPCPVQTHLHETGVNVGCKIKESGGTILVARLSYELRRNRETGGQFPKVTLSFADSPFKVTRIPCTSSTRRIACILVYCNLETKQPMQAGGGIGYESREPLICGMERTANMLDRE